MDELVATAVSHGQALAIAVAMNAFEPLHKFAKTVVNGHDQAAGDDILVVKLGRQALDEAGLPR